MDRNEPRLLFFFFLEFASVIAWRPSRCSMWLGKCCRRIRQVKYLESLVDISSHI